MTFSCFFFSALPGLLAFGGILFLPVRVSQSLLNEQDNY